VSDIEGVWRSHHALILPSRHEGLPICLIEAMMSSRPVIANPAGGSGEVIEDGVTGFLGSSCDVQGLRNLMERAWSERDAWEQMGQSAFNRIRQLIPADPVDQFLKSLGEWLPPSTRVPKRSD
jgi:glycosyltransferase involved in cell wall biosynthesis